MLLLVTGGCGFIGTNFIRLALGRDRETTVVNLDKVTYAGNPANLADAETRFGPGRYTFVHGDICDAALVRAQRYSVPLTPLSTLRRKVMWIAPFRTPPRS